LSTLETSAAAYLLGDRRHAFADNEDAECVHYLVMGLGRGSRVDG
jgi:hypothetical protein